MDSLSIRAGSEIKPEEMDVLSHYDDPSHVTSPLLREAASTARLLGSIVLLAASGAAASAPPAPLHAFTVDHESRVDSAADVRFLLDAPAGKHGFVRSANGHLATGDGRRIRFWGVNIAGWTKGSALLPPKKEGALFAAELARLGVNCVRFQFLDLPKEQKLRAGVPETLTPGGLVDGSRD